MVHIDVLAEINSVVDLRLKRDKIPDTPRNRITILTEMHQKLSSEGVKEASDHLLLQALEDEIVRLDDEDDRTS